MLALAALAALLVGALAACSDDDPLHPARAEHAALSFRPQLNSFGASALLPINLIRLSVEEHLGGSPVMDPVEVEVAPDDAAWNVHLDVPLPGGAIDVVVIVELINETDGVRTVEWSGQVGPLSLPRDAGAAPEVEMFRGSRANLSITALVIAGADSATEGDAPVLRATATGATGVPQLFWSSLDPTVAAIATAAGDSAVVLTLLPGLARIVVEAGPRADTLELSVAPRGAVVTVEVQPDSLSFNALGAVATLTAAGFDAFGNPCGCAATWTSRDGAVASVDAQGTVTALRNGTTWIDGMIEGVKDSALVDVIAPPMGTTITWLGVASSDWATGANWSTGVAPVTTDTVWVPAGRPNQPVISATDTISGIIVDGTLDVGSSLYVIGDFSTVGGPGGGVLAMKTSGQLTVNGNAVFTGGVTDGLLTEGVLSVHGDFHAENGAFQASNNHTTMLVNSLRPITVSMPTGGAAIGSDHFNHVQLTTNDTIHAATDLWALGNLSDNPDAPGTVLSGTGQTFHSDGWILSSGLTVDNVTLELDADVNPVFLGSVQMDNISFVDYSTGVTRVRIRHPGLLRSTTIQFNGIDFASSQPYPGAYAHAIDSDAGGDLLDVLFFFDRVVQPNDISDPSRLLMEGGAIISTSP
ncbi:MAG TPA: Ig-like domain-containing protein [Longimicrobiales bacterium]|nr:Ig-like domain-containing protein [Longimicrobiales bacterium]